MGCPLCGQVESVLQSVTSTAYECRAELGGCGAAFDQTAGPPAPCPEDLQEALSAMLDAIAAYETQHGHALAHPNVLDNLATQRLLETLRTQISRINSAIQL